MQGTRSLGPPDRAAPDRSGVVRSRTHAATARKRAVAATIAERGIRRAAGAGLTALRPPAPESPPEGAFESMAVFSRHTLGSIEAERDRRLQRRAPAVIAHAPRAHAAVPHPRIAAALASNARTVRLARLAIDRWVDEGGLVPFEAAAVLRSTAARS